MEHLIILYDIDLDHVNSDFVTFFNDDMGINTLIMLILIILMIMILKLLFMLDLRLGEKIISKVKHLKRAKARINGCNMTFNKMVGLVCARRQKKKQNRNRTIFDWWKVAYSVRWFFHDTGRSSYTYA